MGHGARAPHWGPAASPRLLSQVLLARPPPHARPHSGLCSDSVASAALDLDKMPQPRRLLSGGEGLVTRAGGPAGVSSSGGEGVSTEGQREEPGQ